MTWIDFLWPVVTGACLTLALINLRIAFVERPRAARLLFSLSAFWVAFLSVMELAGMRADSAARYEAVLGWGDLATWAAMSSLTAFIWVFFGTGTRWLALAGSASYGLGLLFYLGPDSGLLYLRITGVKTVETYGGAIFHVAEGVPNPWGALAYAGVLLMLAFAVDASIQLWRRGNGRRAAIIGGSLVFFILAAGVQSALIERGVIYSPYLISWFYLAILVTMGHELSKDVFAATELARQLRESQERMTLAAEAANLGIWMWNVDRDELWMSDRGLALFATEPGVIPSYSGLRERVHPEDRQRRDETIQRAVRARGMYELEYRIPLPDGTVRWLATRGRCFCEPDGGNPRLLGVSMDITPRKRAEAALRENEMELQRQRAELSHASRVSTLGQLASSLAHELNQPLGAILRNVEAAELFMQSESPDLDEIRAILTDVRKDDQRAGKVIDRMRGLLQRRSLELHPLSLSELAEEVAVFARVDAAARHAAIERDIPEGLPDVLGDRVHLQQVLLNLVLNAMDALDGNSDSSRTVSVRARLDGAGSVRMSVSDEGRGIHPEQLGRLFEPFFTTKPHGMGVGLAICRTIVEAHGGRIWAENNTGQGATFHVTLSAASPENIPSEL